MLDLLAEPLIETSDAKGARERLSLPQLYERLAADEVAAFPSLRPHQRHAWHALLCQLGALACLRTGLEALPQDAAGWRSALTALTPDYPGGEPWHLVGQPDQPAFLQSPVDKGFVGFKPIRTPDQLDMLVTAKNHDVKATRLEEGQPEDWLFALVTLQTMEGFLGAGNYGVSRMNGGFANRPGVTLAPPGGVGAHVMRDLKGLIRMRDEVLDAHPEFAEDGLALVWLRSWDGATSLSPRDLDPYYIEICRRVRLIERDVRISALAAGSKAPRITFGKQANGLTGDPWTPVEINGDGTKALTVDARGFAYKRLADIVFEAGFQQALLQQLLPGDRLDASHTLICRALARGQGKTEGLHERRLHVSPKTLRCWRSGELEPLARLSQDRIENVGKVSGALRFGLMVLFQNGPSRTDFKARDPSSGNRAAPFVARFETDVDRDFFERLFAEFESEDDAAQREERTRWLADLRDRAHACLRAAEAGAPSSVVRHYRASVRAEGAFLGAFYKAFRNPYFPKEVSDVAA